MSMSWLSRFFGKIAGTRQQPEAQFIVSFDGIEFLLRNPEGAVHCLKLADLGAVIVETNDTGPWGMDVWWVLLNQDGKLGLLYPQGATGESLVMDRLMALPGFDTAELIKAMGSTAKATFPVWRKSDGVVAT